MKSRTNPTHPISNHTAAVCVKIRFFYYFEHFLFWNTQPLCANSNLCVITKKVVREKLEPKTKN